MNRSFPLIEPEEVPALLDAGYRAFDPHLHTWASHDVIPTARVAPRRLYEDMLARGWGLVAFTDHDTLDAYREFPEAPDRLVRGVEITIKPKRVGEHTHTHTLHVNVYLLTDDQLVDLETIAASGDFDAFIDYLRIHELRYVLNHPFWHETYEVPNWAMTLDVLRRGCFPVTEYNWARMPAQNGKVLEMARQIGVPVWGGSDNHLGHPGRATLVKGDTFEEVWENVLAGQCRLVRQQRATSAAATEVVTDAGSYAEYVIDTVSEGAAALIRVTGRELQANPVSLRSGSFWRDGLFGLITNGSLNRVCPITTAVGHLIARNCRRFGPTFARPFVESQVEQLAAIAAALDVLPLDRREPSPAGESSPGGSLEARA